MTRTGGDAASEERLAEAIHRVYLEQRLATGEGLGSTSSLVEWEALPEEFKASCRERGRDTQKLLAQLGYVIRPARPGRQGTQLTRQEVEELARCAHERWLEERERSGWRFGGQRDDDRRLHPDLVPWEKLSDDRREIDRYLMRELPGILAEFGMMLARPSASSQRWTAPQP